MDKMFRDVHFIKSLEREKIIDFIPQEEEESSLFHLGL